MSQIGIIIPTWNNNQYLLPCIRSIVSANDSRVKVYVVNNGEKENMVGLEREGIVVLQQDHNLGWEGGLKAGLSASSEEFVIFMNDDTLIPLSSKHWIDDMLWYFKDPKIGAVGPSSNCVMGSQSIFADIPPTMPILKSTFLIGFCMMVRRSALDECGGIDDSLPGGDDLDLSIRFRSMGYSILINRNAFVYHHGFKTGERVNGGPNIDGGWNSIAMTERTNFALIRKHGLRAWISTMTSQILGVYELQQA